MPYLLKASWIDGTPVYHAGGDNFTIFPKDAHLYKESPGNIKRTLSSKTDLDIEVIPITDADFKSLIQEFKKTHAILVRRRLRNIIDSTGGPSGSSLPSILNSAANSGVGEKEVKAALQEMVDDGELHHFVTGGLAGKTKVEIYVATSLHLYQEGLSRAKAAEEAREEAPKPSRKGRKGPREVREGTSKTKRVRETGSPRVETTGGPWKVMRDGQILWSGSDKKVARKEARGARGGKPVTIEDGAGNVTNTY